MRPIDADKLIQFVDYSAGLGGLWGRMLTVFKTVIKEIVDVQPTIEPERAGHWVEIGDEPCDEWECDRCGFVIDGSGCIDPEKYRDIYIFCPHCGSMMLKEGDAE